MKVIVAGSRKGIPDELVYMVLDESPFDITEVVCGEAQGPDSVGRSWANERSLPIASFPYPSEYGRAGGPIRNEEMAKYGDALIAFWDGKSRGTKNMIDNALKYNLQILVINTSSL